MPLATGVQTANLSDDQGSVPSQLSKDGAVGIMSRDDVVVGLLTQILTELKKQTRAYERILETSFDEEDEA